MRTETEIRKRLKEKNIERRNAISNRSNVVLAIADAQARELEWVLDD